MGRPGKGFKMRQKTAPAWFEIPSVDLDRAVRFYEGILETKLAREDMGRMRMGVFPHEKPLPTGAVVHAPGYEPASQGSVVYLNVDDIRPVLARVPAAGGEVALPLTALPGGAGSRPAASRRRCASRRAPSIATWPPSSSGGSGSRARRVSATRYGGEVTSRR